MIFDNEQQKKLILGLIDNTPINGAFGQIIPAMNAIAQLRQEVENATVGVNDAATTGCNCTERESV